METLQKIIDKSDNIVFFGGAGVSTESGIPDFRSENGIYNQKYKFPPEIMLSNSFFGTHTQDFFDFYREKMIFQNAKPNDAHYTLAKLEQSGKLKGVITQNIDGLHTKAGSKNVIELHGCVERNYCMKCNKLYDKKFLIQSTGIPKCSCGGIVKPDVVLYGEAIKNEDMSRAISLVKKASTLIVGGTSLSVFPAAGIIDYFKGIYLVLISLKKTSADSHATLTIRAPIAETFSKLDINQDIH